jgi:hypothetical protein
LLQKAIGVSTVKVLLALARGTTRTKPDLEQAVDIISVEVPRMLRLFRKTRERRLSFEEAAREQGKILLRKMPAAANANDKLLDAAIDLPLQFLADWVRWDKEPEFQLQLILAKKMDQHT